MRKIKREEFFFRSRILNCWSEEEEDDHEKEKTGGVYYFFR